ncbi:BON domain-containing protein [Rhizobium wenxiniae]|uniref:BON domain-containing protein n=1 Tax=Rhizobium wenxiniae TaxID=1737357 RepID=UPI001C6ED499|nr:BON domain-containing protein [Rhizobium wenxiniae]MBW9087509.1 BON domain-containing protein [Rhizobium wenxiniae]
MSPKRDVNDISREEDFRDFDDRNVDDGWPYADKPGQAAGPVDNAAYGNTNPETETGRNPGFLIDEAGFDGLQEPQRDSLRPGTTGLENWDDLEERVTDAIDALGIIDMDLIDIHVDRNNVTIEGQVDDAATSHAIVRAAQKVSGIGRIINHLRLAGVDSRIPDED